MRPCRCWRRSPPRACRLRLKEVRELPHRRRVLARRRHQTTLRRGHSTNRLMQSWPRRAEVSSRRCAAPSRHAQLLRPPARRNARRCATSAYRARRATAPHWRSASPWPRQHEGLDNSVKPIPRAPTASPPCARRTADACPPTRRTRVQQCAVLEESKCRQVSSSCAWTGQPSCRTARGEQLPAQNPRANQADHPHVNALRLRRHRRRKTKGQLERSVSSHPPLIRSRSHPAIADPAPDSTYPLLSARSPISIQQGGDETRHDGSPGCTHARCRTLIAR